MKGSRENFTNYLNMQNKQNTIPTVNRDRYCQTDCNLPESTETQTEHRQLSNAKVNVTGIEAVLKDKNAEKDAMILVYLKNLENNLNSKVEDQQKIISSKVEGILYSLNKDLYRN